MQSLLCLEIPTLSIVPWRKQGSDCASHLHAGCIQMVFLAGRSTIAEISGWCGRKVAGTFLVPLWTASAVSEKRSTSTAVSVVRKVLSVGTFPNRIVFSTVYYSYSASKIISIPAVYGTVKDVMFVLVTYISEVKFNYPSLVYLKA